VSKGRWRENRVFQRLQVWVIFDVLVTLTPFAFGYLQSIDKDQAFQFSGVLGGGQLLLVAVAIAASAIGELIAIEVSETQKVMKIAAIGLAFIVVIVSALWFGDISAAAGGKATPDEKTISLGSVSIYVWTLCASAWCLTLAEGQAEILDKAGKGEAAEKASLTLDDEES
jgi:hypothetical protein